MSESVTLNDLLQILFDGIYKLKEEHGYEIYPVFQVLPLRKDYPDYYKIIKFPLSLSTIKKRLSHYTDSQDFINDLARVTWNARTYNTKESEIYKYALILDAYIKNTVLIEIQKKYSMVQYPYLGHLPDEPILSEVPHVEEMNKHIKQQKNIKTEEQEDEVEINDLDEEDMEDDAAEPSVPLDDEDDEDYTEEKKSLPKIRIPAITPHSIVSSQPRVETPQPLFSRHKEQKTHMRRGRPPVIDLPFEQRIKNVLKNLKREIIPGSKESLTSKFDKLPDEDREPQYYTVISNPLSLDDIRKKVKQRKYKDFQAFQKDTGLMLNNYRMYHRSQPVDIRRATEFETRFSELAKYELSRPDEDFMTDGELKYPMEFVEVDGKSYRIGDWILLNNPNDETKPTVAQIFRLWHTSDGRRWLNCCWYLRPEQTVHRVDRLFYKNEVVKSGQYRDHLVEEIVGKCYVCHFTRFQRGDPDIKLEGPLFLCEYRYNESEKVFNKIRTWKGCLPEEMRDVEEGTIPVPGRKFFKYESPIKHLLLPNATVNDPIPQPTEGAVNAPPLVGAVYIRPKLRKDDLGEYYTSDDCPRYIIRPGDPPEPGKIDLATGTLVTNTHTASTLPKMNLNPSRLTSLSRNPSFPSINSTIRPGTSVHMGSKLPLTIENTRVPQVVQQSTQQQHPTGKIGSQGLLQPAYQPASIINNLAAQAKTNTSVLGNIVVDFPGACVLPLSITKNVEVLQRADYNNQVRRLGKEVVPKKKKSKGEVIWFKDPGVVIPERLLNSGTTFETTLNRWFKRRKLEYEEVDEEIGDVWQAESVGDEFDCLDDEDQDLPGTFPLGLRPSASYMAHKITQNGYA